MKKTKQSFPPFKIGDVFSGWRLIKNVSDGKIKKWTVQCKHGKEKTFWQSSLRNSIAECKCENPKYPIGDKKHKLTITGYTYKENTKQLRLKVLCDCGNERIIQTSQFGRQNCCGCEYKHTFNKGEQFNLLTFTGETKVIKNSQHGLCECVCGNKIYVRFYTLYKTKTETGNSIYSCGCHMKSTNFKKYFVRIRISAKAMKRDFAITLEDIENQFKKQNGKCAFSGVELTFPTSPSSTDGTVSIDRIDSSKGYLKDNIHWVHKELNIMKNDWTCEEFINWCHKVSEYQKVKDNNNE